MKNAEDRIGDFKKFGSVLGLERISELLKRLGDPQEGLRVIHVAGTNGKGSVCRYIYEVLESNGYKAGIYTSPFIEYFNERIEFDHECISDEDLEKYTDMVIEKCNEMTADGLDSPTEFEVVTAVCFCYFADKKPDFAILEVGLGGIGDSTNVIEDPLVSVITGISYDHMDRLGNTLEEIAENKAGIIKEGCPVVSNISMDDAPGAARVVAKTAYRKHAVLHDASRATIYKMELQGRKTVFTADIDDQRYSDVAISMLGEHQVTNAVTALTAIEILRKNSIINVTRDAIYEGMESAFQKGRFEIFKEDPIYLLDGAHNQEGMEALVKAVDDVFHGGKVLTVIGILADKAVDDMLDMAQYLGEDFIVTEPVSERKMSADELGAKLKSKEKNVTVIADPAQALAEAEERSGDYDIVLFAGSLYLIGEIRRQLNKNE